MYRPCPLVLCLPFSIMIPMDTVKTRLVTQTAQAGIAPYQGVLGTLSRVINEEGFGALYRSLTPRLVSVVPMIGIQVRRCRAFSALVVDFLRYIDAVRGDRL